MSEWVPCNSYVQEAISLAKQSFPQMAPIDDAIKITSELHDSNARKSLLRNKKERRPNREHWCGAGRIPSEGQVKTILTTLEC